MDGIDSDLHEHIELTCATLQSPESPIIQKPRLTYKYLSRPPFRYLHDIISAVQNGTGFAAHLYTEKELDARAFQDKNSKVAYLLKMVMVVSLVLGMEVPVNPFKMVAGLESDNTNTFLQMLGKACTLNDGADAVQAVLYHAHVHATMESRMADGDEACDGAGSKASVEEASEEGRDSPAWEHNADAAQQAHSKKKEGSGEPRLSPDPADDADFVATGCLDMPLSVTRSFLAGSISRSRSAINSFIKRRRPSVLPCPSDILTPDKAFCLAQEAPTRL